MDSIQFIGHTDPGRRRRENQDAYITRPLWSADKALVGVIDGVGGYTGGEKAAAIAKDCIEQYMQVPSGDTLTMLREAVIFANNCIVEERKKDQLTSEMCCVLTAVVADAATHCMYYAHVGDTRLYRCRDGKLQKLTRDHSFVGIKEDAGEISEEEAMGHPHRNQILREVGSTTHRLDDEDFMDFGREAMEPGDQLLLCSDGLTDMITSQNIIQLLSADQPLENKVNDLIALANEHGGHDNITVVLLQLEAVVTSSLDKRDTPVPAVVPQTMALEADSKKKAAHGKNTLVLLFLLLVLITGTGWYFTAPKRPVTPTGVEVPLIHPKDSAVTDTSYMASAGREIHPAVQGPVKPEIADTLRISSTQNFADLTHYTDSTGRSLVLVPKKNTNNRFAAIAITRHPAKAGDTVIVKNIRVSGFETGIAIHLPLKLKAENLVFENTAVPFRYFFKADAKQGSVLFINTLKQ